MKHQIPGSALRPGRLVAKLSFGFWVNLCTPGYNGTVKGPGLLWPLGLPHVFPGLPAKAQLRSVTDALRAILDLRNRVMHHERLTGRQTSVADEYVNLLRMIGWLDPDFADVLPRLDRFGTVTEQPAQRRHDRIVALLLKPGSLPVT
jgi:hypothetical protein